MPSLLRISEAASLAIHSLCLMAKNPEENFSTARMASRLHASKAHLSKVMQRLSRLGMVVSSTGPRGGFRLKKDSKSLSLLEIYEAVEGKLEPKGCLLKEPICRGKKCIFGKLLVSVDKQISDYMRKTCLSDLLEVFVENGDEEA